MPFVEVQSKTADSATRASGTWVDWLEHRVSSQTTLITCFTLVLLVGGTFRFIGLDWDQQQHLHPDERFLTMVEAALQWPASFGEYLDEARSPLNPRNVGFPVFVYGTLPTTIVKTVATVLGRTDYDRVHLVGRALSGVCSLASIVFLFLLAHTLYGDRRVALLSTALLSATALAIQHAHFFVVDPYTNFCIVVALFWLARAQKYGRIRDYVPTGFFFGMALASKLSVFSFAVVVALVGSSRVWRVWEAHRVSRNKWAAKSDTLVCIGQTTVSLLLAALMTILAFRLAQPDAFRGPGLLDMVPSDRWLANIASVRELINGNVDYPPGLQWTNRAPLWFPLKNMVLWGTGLPLGLMAWVGWGVAAWRLVKRREWMHLIPVTWVSVLFLHQGTQWVKSLRYFLPIYPMLALLAAWVLVWLWDRARDHTTIFIRKRRVLVWTPLKALLLIGGVTVGTLGYALGFATIYLRPHSRVQASRWIYAHVPPGSTLANEHWDDALPLPVDGNRPFAGLYRSLEMKWYDDDSPEKLQTALGWLDQADFIILSSNRLYDSIPRLPMRYPMTIRYYEALFDGRLGFEKVAEFNSYPRFCGIEIPDQRAEEAFSVYDHPRVQLFRKTAAYGRAQAERILGGVDWHSILNWSPKQATRAPTALLLPSNQWDCLRQRGGWSQLFDSSGIPNRQPVLVWVLFIEILGLIGAPYFFMVGGSLPDRGYVFAKAFGLLLSGWLIWALASLRLLSFSRSGIWLTVLLLGGGAVVLFHKQLDAWKSFWREHHHVLLGEEALFWGFFGLFLWVRWANPDLWHPFLGGEKPMDFAYLNAVIKSAGFPPYDPWFAGGYINYYYFGFVLMATPVKATGIVPQVAYNLMIPTLFAMTAMGAFGVTLALLHGKMVPVGRRTLGISFLGAIFVAVIGNLGELKLILDGVSKLSTLSWNSSLPGLAYSARVMDGLVNGLLGGATFPVPIEWWYWNATRLIPHAPGEPGPITEFPWFTFLYGDLHAHMMALPLTLLVLGLALAVVRGLEVNGWNEWLRLGFAALALGALWPTNTWDFPTYGLVVFIAVALRQWRCQGQVTLGGLWQAGRRWALVTVLSYVLFLPFHQWYGAAHTRVELWKGSHTPLWAYLMIHGFFLFVMVSAMICDFRFGRGQNGVVRTLRTALRHRRRLGHLIRLHQALVRSGSGYACSLLAVGGAVVFGLVLVLFGYTVPGVAIWLLTPTVLLLFRREPNPCHQMALAFFALGLSLTCLVEFIVLKNDIGRMNTVFKFHLQVWVLFGLATAAGTAVVWEQWQRWTSRWRLLWQLVFAMLLAAAMLYPLLATPAKIKDRFDTSVGPTLDGSAFMQKSIHRHRDQTIELVWDRQAIEWLHDNVSGSPVIAEMNTHPTLYGWGNRYAMFTGLPAIAGWDWHQRQQRALLPSRIVGRRVEDVKRIYNTSDPDEAYEILRRYGADYLIVGELERIHAAADGIAKFESMDGVLWDLVYENPAVQIYRVSK